MRNKWTIGAIAALLAAAGVAVGSSAAASPPPSDVQPNVVGGDEAVGPTGWMGAVSFSAPEYNVFDMFVCGGILGVDRSSLISAAHCGSVPTGAGRDAGDAQGFGFATEVAAIPVDDRQYKVRLGSKDRTKGGVLVEVIGISVHEDWQWGVGAPAVDVADVTVFHLAKQVDIQPLKIATTKARHGDRVTMYGWGIDSPNPHQTPDMAPRRLQQLETTVGPDSDCVGGFASRTDICVRNVDDAYGACNGDSGGPIVRFTRGGVPELVGIISRPGAAGVCGAVPTVATSASAYRMWARDTVAEFVPPPASPREKPVENTLPYEPPMSGS